MGGRVGNDEESIAGDLPQHDSAVVLPDTRCPVAARFFINIGRATPRATSAIAVTRPGSFVGSDV